MSEIRPATLPHRLELPCVLASIPQAQAFIRGFLDTTAATPDFVWWMELVIDEAVVNAVSHGGPNAAADRFRIGCQIIGDSLQIQVEDFQGRLFDPEYFRRIAAVKDWGRGGRGILLISTVMDHVSYLINEGNHTVLFMEKQINAPIIPPLVPPSGPR